jgi:hypothetical protein
VELRNTLKGFQSDGFIKNIKDGEEEDIKKYLLNPL